MKIPMKYIIEIGMLRKRNQCAKCENKIDVEKHNIQLCKSCRVVKLAKPSQETGKNKK